MSVKSTVGQNFYLYISLYIIFVYHSLCFTLFHSISFSLCLKLFLYSFSLFLCLFFLCLFLSSSVSQYFSLHLTIFISFSMSISVSLSLSHSVSLYIYLSLTAFHSLYFSQSQTVLLYVSLSQPFSVSFSFIVFHCVFFPMPLSLLSNKYTITFPCSPAHAKNVLVVQLCNGDSEQTVLAVRIKFHFVNQLTPVWIIVWIPGVGIEVLL